MFDEYSLKIFFEIHSGNPREGPGSLESTSKAFKMMTELLKQPKILDLGCGPGKQTMDLYNISNGYITAVDNHAPFIELLNKTAEEKRIVGHINAVLGNMAKLQVPKNRFDIIWAEGAIYQIGFEHGLKIWNPFLKSQGYIAVTELSWLKQSLPNKIEEY